MSDEKGKARRSIKAMKTAKVARKNAESMWAAANKVGPAYGESVESAAGRIKKYRESVKKSTPQGSYAKNYFKKNSK